MGLKSPKDKANSTQKQPTVIENTPLTNSTVISQPAVKLNTYPQMSTFVNRPQVGLRVGGL